MIPKPKTPDKLEAEANRAPTREEIALSKLADEARQARTDLTFWELDNQRLHIPEEGPRTPRYRGARVTWHNLPHPTGLNRATRRARGL